MQKTQFNFRLYRWGTCFILEMVQVQKIISSTTSNKDEAIIDVNCSSDGNYEDLIKTPGGGSIHCSQEVFRK